VVEPAHVSQDPLSERLQDLRVNFIHNPFDSADHDTAEQMTKRMNYDAQALEIILVRSSQPLLL
jgi:hypothetical protein